MSVIERPDPDTKAPIKRKTENGKRKTEKQKTRKATQHKWDDDKKVLVEYYKEIPVVD